MQETQRHNREILENSRAARPPLAHPPSGRPRLAMWIATGLGSGFSPRAPGTLGTLVGAILIWALQPLQMNLVVAGWVALLAVGWWASKVWSEYRGQSDCQEIVIDEILGIYVAWLVAEALTWSHATSFLLKLSILFVLFRFFDVLKPWPIRMLDRWGKSLPLGWSQGGMVIVDDLLAGVLAGITADLIARFL